MEAPSREVPRWLFAASGLEVEVGTAVLAVVG